MASHQQTNDGYNTPSAQKLWGGRFTGATDPIMEKFNNSIGYDKKLWQEDIQGSIAYAKALARCKILSDEEASQICDGLALVRDEWEKNEFVLVPSDEDIHTANERRLTELIGKTGGKLHTGRSRNDQVATDVRLWVRNTVTGLTQQLLNVILVACAQSEKQIDVLQAGFTHLQPAQVIRFSHWLMSYIVPLTRDLERLVQLQG
ncbi:argininosuccinate lyase, partial [archaeon]